jgi:hypothetical protein
MAVGALNLIGKGVFIAMNGRIYPWESCKKLETGDFVERIINHA